MLKHAHPLIKNSSFDQRILQVDLTSAAASTLLSAQLALAIAQSFLLLSVMIVCIRVVLLCS